MRMGLQGRRLGEVLLATILCLGLFIVMGMLAPISTNLTGGHIELFARRVVFDREGIPRIEFREVAYSYKERTRKVTWYDIDGNEIGTYPEHRAPALRLGGIVDFNAVLRSAWRGGRRADLTGWRYLPPPGAEVPIWHLLPYRGLLVGHLYPYGRLIGHLGPEGPVEPDDAEQRFVNPRYIGDVPNLGSIWVDVDRIYAIDLAHMTVRKLWQSKNGPIRALGWVNNMGILLCGNQLEVIDVTLRTRLKAELPEKLRGNVAWQVAWLKDRLVISNVTQMHAIVYHLFEDGRQSEPWVVNVPLSRGMSRTRKVALTVAASIMSPWAGAGLDRFMALQFPEVHRLIENWLNWPYRPTFFALSLTFTVVSTLLTWWHLRRRSSWFDMALGLIVTLVFSWTGHLVCRTLFEVPARVKCPACRRPRPTDRPKCPSCSAGWPPPPQSGYEIILPIPPGKS
ncbi:MAG: hypothetical protein JXQ73_18670 [Phycisphaerae bacterium]|nr:hypothetical protein [Phycisphaerae bacterium]